MKKWTLILPLVLLALAACVPASQPESEPVAVVVEPTQPPPTVSPPPTAVSPTSASAQPTDAPTPETVTAVPTSQPTASPEPEPAFVAGRTTEGAFFLGAADAPVTMIDYSDFL